MNIKIILVEPAGALNVGSVARIMKNMGLRQLVLVNSHCDPLSAQAQQMAVHAQDILAGAQQVDTLAAALVGCKRAIATTARQRSASIPLETPRQALPWLVEENVTSALIFGPEDRGLSNSELNYAQRFVCIPSHPNYLSLNLAQAVAVCAYELYLTSLGQNKSQEVIKTPLEEESAPLDLLESYYQHLESILLKIGYLYPHTTKARMEKFRRLFNRASLSREEVAMLRGILRQIEWATSQTSQQFKD